MYAKNKIVLFLFFIALGLGCQNKQAASVGSVEDYSAINPQREFVLHDQNGKIFRLSDHRGQVILLFFGYTTCPDECPTTLSKLARVYKILGQSRRSKILTVFITIDPAVDTPQKLKEYLEYFDINAIGLTGTKTEIDAVVNSYKASYNRVETKSSALGYMFDHSDYVYLVGPQGATAGLFHPDDPTEEMAAKIRKVMENNGKN